LPVWEARGFGGGVRLESSMTVIEKPEIISVRELPNGSERLIQDIIADDPSVLGGLGNLVLRDKERTQPSGGRLDILLQDEDRTAWYEVEVQLGSTNPDHIIRTIEYWDRERRRYPDVRHTAVIVAEEITGRFFNVISLFNQSIPIIAYKISALKLGGQFGVIFTKILAYEPKGLETEDENGVGTRQEWEKSASPVTMGIADEIIKIAEELNPGKQIGLKFNKSYITTTLDGRISNRLYFVPQKQRMKLWISLNSEPENDKLFKDSGFDANYSPYYGGYQFDLHPGDIDSHRGFLKTLMAHSYGVKEN